MAPRNDVVIHHEIVQDYLYLGTSTGILFHQDTRHGSLDKICQIPDLGLGKRFQALRMLGRRRRELEARHQKPVDWLNLCLSYIMIGAYSNADNCYDRAVDLAGEKGYRLYTCR